ncbi:MAG: transposase [Chitinivibrionales bacterium]|nr:transposase [Chitinivibrionales bacterium]
MDVYNLPIGGTDYPRTFSEFDEWFSSESDCLDFIRKLRWPNGFVCSFCQNPNG